MILEDLVLQSRVNVKSDVFGLDSLEKCLNKDHFLKYPHQVEYQFNSRGFRDSEWPDSIEELKNAIWCIGDSFTVGLGSPYEFTWPQVLAASTGLRCINVSMDGASNAWISRRAQQIVREVAPARMVVLWSYVHRREHPNTEWSDQSRRMHLAKRDSEIEDLENFVSCYKQLNTPEISTAIFNGAIPNYIYEPYCKTIWNNLRDPSWPVQCPQRKLEFLDLPEYVQQELFIQEKIKQQFELMFAHTEFLDHHALCSLTNLDYARDYHHFDIDTSKFFVEEICKNLFTSN